MRILRDSHISSFEIVATKKLILINSPEELMVYGHTKSI